MLAICTLCATLSKESLLIAIPDRNHSIIQQLQHCFKLELTLHKNKNYACNDCIKSLNDCAGFFSRIERAQETLKILFNENTQTDIQKPVNPTIGAIRTKDFCKIQNKTDNKKNGNKEPFTNPHPPASENNLSNIDKICQIEEFTYNDQGNDDIPEMKIEYDDPLEANENNLEENSNERSGFFETVLRDVLQGSNIVVENSYEQHSEQATSDESPFAVEDAEKHHSLEESSSKAASKHENTSTQIRIGVIKYQCETCLREFPNEQLLQKHLRFNNSDRAYKCKNCPKIFHNPSTLHYHTHTHLRSASQEGAYKCGICSKYYHQLDGLENHLRTHSAERTFQCNKCWKKFRHASTLWYHMKAHSNEQPFQCPFCPKGYCRREALENHLARHEKNRLFTCVLCKKTTNNQQKFKKHMTEHHKIKPYSCEKCSNTFTTSTGLNNHMRNHNRNLYKCGNCSREFVYETSYKQHMRSHLAATVSTETVSTRLQCKNCTRAFTSQRSFNAHTCGIRIE